MQNSIVDILETDEMKLDNSRMIHTDRLCLHSITENDKDDMIELLTNAEISKTFMIPDFKSHEEEVQMFEALKMMSVSEEHFVYGIYLNDKMIGFINDVDIGGKEIELGYVIHPNQQNKGYATEVLQKALAMILKSGYTSVKAGAFEENRASMRVMEKCGMKRAAQEDTIEYRGKKHRCIYYVC